MKLATRARRHESASPAQRESPAVGPAGRVPNSMLLDLPNELTLLVLRSLPPRSLEPLGRLCCTCRALRRMANTSALWRTLCHGIFTEQELAAAYPSGAPQWRDACRQLLFERARSRRWKARQRLEEAKGRRAAGAVEKSPPVGLGQLALQPAQDEARRGLPPRPASAHRQLCSGWPCRPTSLSSLPR